MRGQTDSQGNIFYYLNLEERVGADHPLRKIKGWADEALKRLHPTFEGMYSSLGRPSIPPERLLKSMVLIALYSVRSDRLFCEKLDHDLLFRWFLDMNVEEASFDASSFSKNRDRLVEHEVSGKFFEEVTRLARKGGLLSDDHFSVDGTLIEAWASMKSFRPKGDSGPMDGGNSQADFKGQKRSNETHRSTTDPDARLYRKGNGQPARLCYSGHVLMENRNGLCVDMSVLEAAAPEIAAAQGLLDRQRKRGIRPESVGADKGYHSKGMVTYCRAYGIKPHLARIEGRKTPGLDVRNVASEGYRLSQKLRKRIEEIFGWMKTVGGLRKTRFRGLARVCQHAQMVAASYNLLRISRLMPLQTG